MFGIMSTSSRASNEKCLITGSGHSRIVGPQFIICFISHFRRPELEVNTNFGDLWTPAVTGSYSMKRPQTSKIKATLYRKIKKPDMWAIRGSISRSNRFFSSPKRPERLWAQPSLLFNGYQRLFPRG
jgi:hypothetical protein